MLKRTALVYSKLSTLSLAKPS